jgi:hypothetical protein
MTTNTVKESRTMRQQRGIGVSWAVKAAALAAVIGAVSPSASAQSVFDVSFQSSRPLTGTLLFDLTNGDAAANNSVSITSGAFASVLLTETNPNGFFLSQSRPVSNITSLAFRLTLSQQFAGGSPDEFAFFFYNPAETLPIVTTNDPTGANALFVVDITGAPSGSLRVFGPTTSGVSYSITPATAVPDPIPEMDSAMTLGGILGVTGLLLVRRHRRRDICMAR